MVRSLFLGENPFLLITVRRLLCGESPTAPLIVGMCEGRVTRVHVPLRVSGRSAEVI